MHLQCDGLQPDKPERYEMRQSQVRTCLPADQLFGAVPCCPPAPVRCRAEQRRSAPRRQQYAKEPQLDNPGIHILSEVSDRKELEALYADHDPSKLEELRGGGAGGAP